MCFRNPKMPYSVVSNAYAHVVKQLQVCWSVSRTCVKEREHASERQMFIRRRYRTWFTQVSRKYFCIRNIVFRSNSGSHRIILCGRRFLCLGIMLINDIKKSATNPSSIVCCTNVFRSKYRVTWNGCMKCAWKWCIHTFRISIHEWSPQKV